MATTKIKVLFGSITFFDEQIDGIHKAIVHRVDETVECNSIDEACEVGELGLDKYDAYLIPDIYTGKIEML